MARSLSLSAYLTLARRATASPYVPFTQRPQGELVLGVVDTTMHIEALVQLGARLQQNRPRLNLLIAAPKGIAKPAKLGQNVYWTQLPDEQPDEVDAFLAHWSPDVGLWTGGHLRPALISMASDRGLTMYLINADEDGFDDARWRWLPKMTSEILGKFEIVLANSANAAVRLRRLGLPETKVKVTGPLHDGPIALSCVASDREELSKVLTGRPVWAAAMVQPSEIEIVLAAHKSASRLAHRLLLVLVPDDETDSEEFRERLDAGGWRYVVWSEGGFPEEHTQILLADTYGEMGLWYRIAPITLMATSLVYGCRGKNPFEPAALGSAILYGPNVGEYLASYTRFANAGAARIVKDADTLGAAVSRLIAPDQSAAMALAAWEVASQGAEVTDLVLEMVHEALDKAGAN